jgi:hypothetical protein
VALGDWLRHFPRSLLQPAPLGSLSSLHRQQSPGQLHAGISNVEPIWVCHTNSNSRVVVAKGPSAAASLEVLRKCWGWGDRRRAGVT